ncbi:hypothetical protein B0T25DRAFT_521467 [Lasiosphaeria hispida]|uniref:Uncharacterized protein n=1 Tax=Lasiosphaeria hispida TaxID=260671 RepID=A0AAJ0HCS8_9PEZI|nr:hypothetical protein B0T25DRAFT_521467 [Lasiosphaeria hispida]
MPDCAACVPATPEVQGSSARGLRCTQACGQERSRNCAHNPAKLQSPVESIPNHLGLLCSPPYVQASPKIRKLPTPVLLSLLLLCLCLTPTIPLLRGILPPPTDAILMFQASPPRPSPNLPDWPWRVVGEDNNCADCQRRAAAGPGRGSESASPLLVAAPTQHCQQQQQQQQQQQHQDINHLNHFDHLDHNRDWHHQDWTTPASAPAPEAEPAPVQFAWCTPSLSAQVAPPTLWPSPRFSSWLPPFDIRHISHLIPPQPSQRSHPHIIDTISGRQSRRSRSPRPRP